MKLRSSLPHPPGFLYAIPLLNLFGLLLLCYVVSPYFEVKRGISVQLPSSIFELASIPEAAVITMPSAGASRLYFNQMAVSFLQLEEQLEKMEQTGKGASQAIVIRADRHVDSAALREVAELCARKGFRTVLLGGSSQGGNLAEKPEPPQE
jgi:biopolymer transport protein ExbD